MKENCLEADSPIQILCTYSKILINLQGTMLILSKSSLNTGQTISNKLLKKCLNKLILFLLNT